MPQLKENDINQIMQEVKDLFLIPKFNELGMDATGLWLQSLETEVRQNVGVIRGQDYTEFLARGRGPNKNQDPNAKRKWAYGMANNNPQFMAWLSARNLTQYGVQIAYKIADVGTSWYPDGSDLLEVLESQECVDYVRSRVTGLMQLEVKNSFERMVKEVFV